MALPKVMYVGSILSMSQGAMPLLLGGDRAAMLTELLAFANEREVQTGDIAGVAIARFVDGRGVSSRAYSLNGLEIVADHTTN